MNCPTHTDTELEFRAGTYPTGVRAPDGVQEMVYDEWYYCFKCNRGFSPEDLEDERTQELTPCSNCGKSTTFDPIYGDLCWRCCRAANE